MSGVNIFASQLLTSIGLYFSATFLWIIKGVKTKINRIIVKTKEFTILKFLSIKTTQIYLKTNCLKYVSRYKYSSIIKYLLVLLFQLLFLLLQI